VALAKCLDPTIIKSAAAAAGGREACKVAADASLPQLLKLLLLR